MNRIMFFTVFAFIGIQLNAQFRETTWGMSYNEVKATEIAKLLEEKKDDFLVYDVSIAGFDAYCYYQFSENKLLGGLYAFKQQYMDNKEFIDDYETIKSLLIKKYNEPSEDEQIWKDDSFKEDYSMWGYAISKGQLEYSTSWLIDETNIELILDGGDYKVSLRIVYRSTELWHLFEDDSTEGL